MNFEHDEQPTALVQGENGLTEDAGFADQGDVMITARMAADVLGATPMDRPEWTVVHAIG